MSGTFSETWHRVAHLKMGLLPTVKVHKQYFRGQAWYVLFDTYSQRFYRVTPRAYSFVIRLNPRRTLDEIWQQAIEEDPEEAPGQEDVMQLLSQLHFSNLLYFRGQPDSEGIFKRYRKFKEREVAGKLMGFLFVRVPLWDPNAWLDRIKPVIRFFVNPIAGLVWLGVVIFGAALALLQWDRLFEQTQGILSTSNLVWLFLCMAGMKVLHELGHAFVCKRYGGEVHIMGVMFLVFMPLPYMDATASWAFRHRWQRMLVGGVGIIVELFLAAIGAIIWSQTGPGLLNSLAFNVMVIGSVSSLFFNGNPLLRFDGYYILADYLDIPNLYQKAQKQLLYYADRYLLGNDMARPVHADRRELGWLIGYGIGSFFYRIFITVVIMLFVFDQWFAVGVFLALVSIWMWILNPAKKLLTHLVSPALYRHRNRAWSVSLAVLATLTVLLGAVPVPASVRAPGVLQSVEAISLYASVDGHLRELRVQDGQWVQAGDTLAVFENPDLRFDIQITRQQLRETTAVLRESIGAGRSADVGPLEERLLALEDRLDELLEREQRLVVRAPISGHWISAGLNELLVTGRLRRGERLGEIIDTERYRFVAVVAQTRAEDIFREALSGSAEVRLWGQADRVLQVPEITLIPYQRDQLVSPALGLFGGGEIITRPDEQGVHRAAQPFFELRATLRFDAVNPKSVWSSLSNGEHFGSASDPQDDSSDSARRLALNEAAVPVMLHGASGLLRLPLPGEPLFQQGRRALMQLIQARYQAS